MLTYRVFAESLSDRLTAELESQRGDLASLDAMQRELSTMPDLQRQHAALREASRTQQADLATQTSLLRSRDEENRQLLERLQAQEGLIQRMQAAAATASGQQVQLADLKQQLQAALAELEGSKAQQRALQGALMDTKYSLQQIEGGLVPQMQQQIQEMQQQETRMRTELDARTRHIRMHVEQIKQITIKNPFNKRLEAAAASAAAAPSSAAPIVLHGLDSPLEPSTPHKQSDSAASSSSLASDIESFSHLRDHLNMHVLELSARQRLAWGLLVDSDRGLKHAQDELVEAQRHHAQRSKDMQETLKDAQDRLQQLEAQYAEAQQELHMLRSDAEQSLATSNLHHESLKALWQSCQLLHRAYKPLQARFRDVVLQKQYLAKQMHQFQTNTARDVLELRKAMTGFEAEKQVAAGGVVAVTAENGLTTATAATRPLHPYRLHSSRWTLRVVAVAVLAARRIWSLQSNEYGSMHSAGEEDVAILSSNNFVLSSTASNGGGAETTRAHQARREKEMILPPVDDSTPDRAAASLLRLLDHFDSSSIHSVYATAYPQLKRPHLLSSRPTLLQLIASGFAAFNSSRRNRLGSSSAPAPASTHDDLVAIRNAAWFLATRSKELEYQLLGAQNEYVLLIQQSTRTEELLQHEQSRAHSLMRRSVEEAREHEQTYSGQIRDLQQQLALAQEIDKTQRVSKSDYAQLHDTSEMVLQKCKELEQTNHALQSQHNTLKAQADKVRHTHTHTHNERAMTHLQRGGVLFVWALSHVRVLIFPPFSFVRAQNIDKLQECDMVIRSLRRTIDQKQQTVRTVNREQAQQRCEGLLRLSLTFAFSMCVSSSSLHWSNNAATPTVLCSCLYLSIASRSNPYSHRNKNSWTLAMRHSSQLHGANKHRGRSEERMTSDTEGSRRAASPSCLLVLTCALILCFCCVCVQTSDRIVRFGAPT